MSILSLRYFNVGADPTPNAKHNPLTMLRRVAKKSDFVVLKIDIDTACASDPDARMGFNNGERNG